MYLLERKSDGVGDQGHLTVYSRDGEEIKKELDIDFENIKIGDVLEVGAIRSTMFGTDTWWRTTPITEIVSCTSDKLIFNTGNSSYILTGVNNV